MADYKYECAKVRIRDGIGWLTMNRPDKRNARARSFTTRTMHWRGSKSMKTPGGG
jgi:enoyl-CoA hydratase/carnithine racemase